MASELAFSATGRLAGWLALSTPIQLMEKQFSLGLVGQQQNNFARAFELVGEEEFNCPPLEIAGLARWPLAAGKRQKAA